MAESGGENAFIYIPSGRGGGEVPLAIWHYQNRRKIIISVIDQELSKDLCHDLEKKEKKKQNKTQQHKNYLRSFHWLQSVTSCLVFRGGGVRFGQILSWEK